MTKQDMTERFKIPETVLNDYERNVRKTHTESYTDADLALLSQMVTLYEIGFSPQQAQEYLGMNHVRSSTNAVRLALLNQKRRELLNTIHQQEERLSKLDFLRYELQKIKNGGTIV